MKVNYNKIMLDIIESLNSRPRLLLHCCCAPCASAVIPRLIKYFDVDLFFYNPNITDKDEYEYRLNELNRLMNIYNDELGTSMKLVPSYYDTQEFFDAIRGYETQPEGGKRCPICFTQRLRMTMEVAEKNYQYFCTTLTVSPHKNCDIINMIGLRLAEGSTAKYLPSDFKKENGYLISIRLSKQYDLYRQNYCGCQFSKF